MRIQHSKNKKGDGLWRWALLVFVGVALLYGLTRSLELDEWDSIQFALGVRHFDLFSHQPHPPGYPLYLAIAWLGTNFGLSATAGLVWTACVGGAIFVAAWFYLLTRCFGYGPAIWTTALVAITPMSWMTATKALTDAPAAGAFALQLIWFIRYADRGRMRDLFVAGALGGLTTGFRPQYFPIALLLMIGGFFCGGRDRKRRWTVGLAAGAAFVGATLLWFVPTMLTQANLPEAHAEWLTYPRQLLLQWRWRLDKPDVYLGAGDWSPFYLVKRVWRHTFKAWFILGLGWDPRHTKYLAGLILFAGGWILYLWRKPWQGSERSAFWLIHAWWAPAYFLLIFVTLPPDSRYDLPLLPLLLLPSVLGWWAPRNDGVVAQTPPTVPAKNNASPIERHSRGGLCHKHYFIARWTVAAMTLLLLLTTLPLALENHLEAAPPIRMLRYLDSIYPQAERKRVWLFLRASRRHADYYGSTYRRVSLTDPNTGTAVEAFAQAKAIYTESEELLQHKDWEGVHLVQVGKWKRSRVIYAKHAKCQLWRVEPGN